MECSLIQGGGAVSKNWIKVPCQKTPDCPGEVMIPLDEAGTSSSGKLFCIQYGMRGQDCPVCSKRTVVGLGGGLNTRPCIVLS